jgi:hypothetical protein
MPEPAVSGGLRRQILEYGHALPRGPRPRGSIPQLMPVSPSQTMSAVELIIEEPSTVELLESHWEHDWLHARISHVAHTRAGLLSGTSSLRYACAVIAGLARQLGGLSISYACVVAQPMYR